MGNLNAATRQFMSKKKNVLLTGLKGSGKKTILKSSYLKFTNPSSKTLDKYQFTINNAKYQNLNIVSFDIDNTEIPTRDYFDRNSFDGMIFVIDAKDRVKLGNINIFILFSGWIRSEFNKITGNNVPDDVIDIMYRYFNIDIHPIIGDYNTAFNILESLVSGLSVCSAKIKWNAPILIYANKHDLLNAMTKEEIIKKLNLKSLERKWNVQICSSKTGDGLQSGVDWITSNLK